MITEEQEYIAKLKGEGYSSAQAYLLYKNRFKKNYSQQGELIQYTPKKGQLRLNDAQAMELNRGSGIDFTPEFAKSGYFVTDEQFEKERQERMMAQNQAENQRRYKITDITAETESPTANRRIWHDKKPEYYTGRQEVTEGKEYTTIPYSQWNAFKNSPEYMKYKGIPSPSMASMQGGGYAPQEYPTFFNNFNTTLTQTEQFDPNRPTQAGLNTHSNFQKAPQSGMYLDPLNNENIDNIPDFEMSQRMSQNKRYNTANNNYDENGNAVDQQSTQQTNQAGRLNIINPFGSVSLETALTTAGQGFGEGDPYKVGVGSSLAALKGARSFLQGYGTGKSDRDTYNNYVKNLNRDRRDSQTYGQQGGIKNSEVIASKAITDQGVGNVNLEGGEQVKRTDGLVQPVVGEPHIKNGKIAQGVNAQLNEGDKVLSDFIKLRAKDIKELKEQYKISLKVGDTPAKALKKIEAKIGLTKETNKLATLAEGLEKVLKIKDTTTKDLSLQTFQTLIATQNEKINSLKQISAVAFDDVFEMQEEQPKKGDGNQLFDKNGKEVTEKNEGVMQQGGVMEMAQKYGISKERAEELISMQMGGMQSAQEEVQEGQQSNPQEEQGEVSQEEQIMQMIMQSLQQGAKPEQIVEQLISMGLPQEQAVQVVQMVIEQAQTSQQEAPQMPQDNGQMMMAQEQQMAQQGGYAQQGKFIYNITTGQNEYRTNERTPLQHAKKGEAYGNIEAQKSMQFLYNNFPDIAQKQFKDNITVDKTGNVTFKKNIDLSIPQEAVRLAQVAKNSRMKNSADVILNNPSRFTEAEVKEAQRYKTEETYLDNADSKKGTADGIRGYDSMNGQFDSGRYSLGLDLVTPEDNQKLMGAGIRTLRQLKESPLLKDLSKDSQERVTEMIGLVGDKDADFAINEFTTKPEQTQKTETDVALQEKAKQVDYKAPQVKNVIPLLPENLRMFPSAIPPLRKSEINLERMQPIKATTEPYLAEQASQQLTNREQLVASGLPPQIQQALSASSGAAGQMAANDAISKVENYNRQNQFATDQFNIGQRAKEDITNEQFAQDYQTKMLGSIANTERDRNNFYIQSNLDNVNKWNTINDANVINARNENYQINPGVGVEYTPGYTQGINKMNSPTQEQLSKWTPEELQTYMRKKAIQDRNNL